MQIWCAGSTFKTSATPDIYRCLHMGCNARSDVSAILTHDILERHYAGLVNQLYSHIAAISLGAMLGAHVVLPPAAVRDSFAHYFSVFKDQNEVMWTAAPLESLIDVKHLINFWQQKGVNVSRVRLSCLCFA